MSPSRLQTLSLIPLFIAFVVVSANCLEFSFPSFPESEEKDLLSNNSNLAKDAIQVTNDLSNIDEVMNTSGRALYYKPFRVWRRRGKGNNETIKASFETEFVLNISPDPRNEYPIGEGLAFVLAADHSLPAGSQGRWLGITNGTSPAIVAVEFDTRKSFPEDLDNNHVGLNLNSIFSVTQASLTSRGINISSGDDLRVRVAYDGQNFTVFVPSSSPNPILAWQLDLSEHLPEKVYVGFSASTGPETFQRNCVKSWVFRGSKIGPSSAVLRQVLIIAVLVSVISLTAAAAFLFYCIRRFRIEDSEETFPSVEDEIRGSSAAAKKFGLGELRRATEDFNPKRKLGKGGFGTVYKGVIEGVDVAVKRVDGKNSMRGKQEFVSEVTTIAGLSHRNLVKLIGWCYEKTELLIVYEFMPHGSLDRFIFSGDGEETLGSFKSATELTWATRLNVVRGVARALEYLHNGCEDRVLHRDVKASNVMIDGSFEARLGDFGLARAVPRRCNQSHHSTRQIAGTPGYMAPESFFTGRATVETDTYAFGVLLLEVLSGRKPGNPNPNPNNPNANPDGLGFSNSLVSWAWRLHSKGRAADVADPRLVADVEEKDWADEVGCVVALGLACCNPNPAERPSMKTILKVLEGEEAPPPIPENVPAFVWPSLPPSFKTDGGNSTQCGQLTLFSDLTGR